MQLGRDLGEDVADVERKHQRDQHAESANAAVGEQAGVDELGKILNVVSGGEFRNVAHNRRADTEVEEPVVAGDGKDEDPDAERGVAQPVQNKGRQENADGNVGR